MDEEFQTHLQLLADRFVSQGMTRDDALLAAKRQFGSVTQMSEHLRERSSFAFLNSLLADARYALRQMRKSPAFACTAILTLAVGIGANTAIFTVVNALMFKALPVQQPERLLQVQQDEKNHDFTYALWQQVRAQQDVFSGAFAYAAAAFDLSTGGEQQVVRAFEVSGGYFDTLGISAVLGRTISAQDDQRGAPPVAVISYGFWQRNFGGDPDVKNRWLTLQKQPFRIIGITPRGFFGTEIGDDFDVIVPLETDRILRVERPMADNPFDWELYITGRLKPGVTLEQARSRLKALAPLIDRAALPPNLEGQGREEWNKLPLTAAPVAGGISALRSQYRRALILLSAMVGVVLLIACGNVANLLLAKASARQREFAVRVALGAKRTRVVRQLLTESFVLAVAGCGVGLLLAYEGAQLLVRSVSAHLDLSLDVRVLSFTIAITIATALLFGLAPGLQVMRDALPTTLKEHAASVAGRNGWEMSRILIVAQMALCVVLVFGAGLFVKTFRGLLSQDMGFNRDGVLLIEHDFASIRATDAERQQLADEFTRRLEALPGICSVSRSVVTPISGNAWQWDVELQDPGASGRKVHAFFNLVSPRYFETLGTPLIAGRNFNDHDTGSSPAVAIMNVTAARKFFPGVDAIGHSFRDDLMTDAAGKPRAVLITVAGIAGDAKYRRLRDDVPPTIYLPIAQNPFGPSQPVIGDFEVRFAGAVSAITNEILKVARDLDPQMSLHFTPLSEQVADSLRQERLLAGLTSVFGLLALVLASVGIYGVMAYTVARRTNEIGVRMALGAKQSHVLAMVVREAVMLVLVGVAVGLPAALASSRVIKTMLFGVRPADPLMIGLTAGITLAVAVLAAYIPARRASRIDPMVALRYE